MSESRWYADGGYVRGGFYDELGGMLVGARAQEIADSLNRLAAAEADAERVTGETSDGYHTFNELYEFRKMYNAALFNEWAAAGKYSVHKSWRHHDGEPCFGGGWFIVVAMLPSGQITNHYEADDWGLFQIPEHEKALFEYDGHTGADTIIRLRAAIDAARGGE